MAKKAGKRKYIRKTYLQDAHNFAEEQAEVGFEKKIEMIVDRTLNKRAQKEEMEKTFSMFAGSERQDSFASPSVAAVRVSKDDSFIELLIKDTEDLLQKVSSLGSMMSCFNQERIGPAPLPPGEVASNKPKENGSTQKVLDNLAIIHRLLDRLGLEIEHAHNI